MTCRFTLELCRIPENLSVLILKRMELQFFTELLNSVMYSETHFPMILTQRHILFKEMIMKIFCIHHLLLIHNMCAIVMGIWLNESSFAAEPDMNPFWYVSCSSPPGPAVSSHASLCWLCFTESCDGQDPFTLPQVSATLWQMTVLRCSFMMIYLSQ